MGNCLLDAMRHTHTDTHPYIHLQPNRTEQNESRDENEMAKSEQRLEMERWRQCKTHLHDAHGVCV